MRPLLLPVACRLESLSKKSSWRTTERRTLISAFPVTIPVTFPVIESDQGAPFKFASVFDSPQKPRLNSPELLDVSLFRRIPYHARIQEDRDDMRLKQPQVRRRTRQHEDPEDPRYNHRRSPHHRVNVLPAAELVRNGAVVPLFILP